MIYHYRINGREELWFDAPDDRTAEARLVEFLHAHDLGTEDVQVERLEEEHVG
jgi:hypothetical protein